MKRLENMESFKNFELSKQSLSQVSGARTKFFAEHIAVCTKFIDGKDRSDIRKAKVKERYEGRC